MRQGIRSLGRSRWIGYGAALVAAAAMTALVSAIASRQRIANVSMLYLVAVIVIAIAFGRGPAIVTSLAAFLSFDWFFVEPLHTFAISDPAEWIALLLFLLVATITSQLAAGQRQRTSQAEQRERDAMVLYDIVGLMGDTDLNRALRAVAERLREELVLAGVAIEVGSDGGTIGASVGEPEALEIMRGATTTSAMVLGEGKVPSEYHRGAPGRWIRVVPTHPRKITAADRLHTVPVHTPQRRVGEMLLVRAAGSPKFAVADNRLLSAVATQLGLAVERAQLRREVTEAEILRRTDELKTALLNAVSHGLRTPLASILAAAGSLRHHDVPWSEDERAQFAAAIEEETIRLNQIIGNLLDLSRIEGGSLRPEKDWYDLATLVDEVLGRLEPMTAQHRIVVDMPEELQPMLLDYVEIDQVLSNLIENATKYTPMDSEIRISARSSDGAVQVAVADNGPGIPEEALAHLFEPFYRTALHHSRGKGTGLGLAVAKGLVEAHGGRISATNRPGGGASFVFTLPLP